MNTNFYNESNHRDFNDNGFVKIPDIRLSTDAVELLKDFWYSSNIGKKTADAVYMAMENADKPKLQEMYQCIQRIVMPVLSKIIKDPIFFYGSFIEKFPNPGVTVLPHQDGTFVTDEAAYPSLTCWIPLVDVDMHNGCMGMLRNSKSVFPAVRPLPSPQVYRPLSKHTFSIMPLGTLIPMKAGEILIFDNRTIHFSPPNSSSVSRLAISSWITVKGASLCMYYLKPGTKDRLLQYAIDADFFQKYDNSILSELFESGKTPEGYELIAEKPYQYHDLNTRTIKKRLLGLGNQLNPELAGYLREQVPMEMNKGVIHNIKEWIGLV